MGKDRLDTILVITMPQKMENVMNFLLMARKDTKSVNTKNKSSVRFKVQCTRNLYVLVTTDKEKAEIL